MLRGSSFPLNLNIFSLISSDGKTSSYANCNISLLNVCAEPGIGIAIMKSIVREERSFKALHKNDIRPLIKILMTIFPEKKAYYIPLLESPPERKPFNPEFPEY